jgi:hypothetical protein
MFKNLFLLISLSISLIIPIFAQNTKTLVLPKSTPEPPPGNIKLLENYTHIKKRGIDTSVGEISKLNGLTIRYDNGNLAGRAAGYYCGNGQCNWYKSQKINGKDVWIGLTKEGMIIATFPEDYANFFAQTKLPEDIADFLLMILTYGNDESTTSNKRDTLNQNASQKPNSSKNLFPVSENGKWGYVDEQGKMIIEPQFEMASDFKNDRAAVVIIDKGYKNLHGYIDKTGKMVVAPQYDEAGDFSDGLAVVSKNYRWGYIDSTGKEVIPLQFIEALDFSEGLAAVYIQSEQADRDSQWGYINKKGEVVIQPKFYKAHKFHSGVAMVVMGKFGETNPKGYIDRTGNFLIKPEIEGLSGDFSEDLIPIEIGGRSEKTGERMYKHISGKWGYVDKTGKTIIEPKFDGADEFSEGLANVTIGKKYGYIDKSGKVVIAPQFEFSSNSYQCAYFSEGLACFERDGKIGFIDKTGKVVIEPQFEFAEKFVGGFTQVLFPSLESSSDKKKEYRGGFGIIDKTGKVLWKPTY